MAGKTPPAGITIDGRDLSGVLTHNAPSPHDQLLLFNDEDLIAVRTQRWKYVTADYYRAVMLDIRNDGYPQLYDMERDPGEEYSVAALEPKALADLKARLELARKTFEPLRTAPSQVVSRPAGAVIPHALQD
jgi:arylsulfatase A-like enzyme